MLPSAKQFAILNLEQDWTVQTNLSMAIEQIDEMHNSLLTHRSHYQTKHISSSFLLASSSPPALPNQYNKVNFIAFPLRIIPPSLR